MWRCSAIFSIGVATLLKSFPLLFANRGLRAEDFSRFSNSYAEILKNHLPTAERVDFLQTTGELANFFPEQPLLHELTSLFQEVKTGEKMIGVHPQCLMLPFVVNGGETVIALIAGADPLFINKVSEDWLGEKRLIVEREFLLLKEARVDIHTGLLNGSNLCYLLDTYSAEKFHLMLVELPPRRNTFQYALRHAQKCATALLDFFQSHTVPHYLGQGIFALVLQDCPGEGKAEVESNLMAYLKREGAHRIHIGSSHFRDGGEAIDEGAGRRLLDEAWTALRHAAMRGPFSYCDYRLLAYPEHHPLRPLDKGRVSRFARFWRNAEVFSLVHFHSEGDIPAARILAPRLDRGEVIVDDDDVLVYLEGVTAGEALAWATACIGRVDDPAWRSRLSAGIGSYPYADFKKPEIPFNCRKALLHAAFYGEPKVAVFDAVSMNISGDIYFGDGDLTKAVREYKRGLMCDELNVNLHNSLGVALAMMGKLGPAMQSLERALSLDEANFMALYNLGLTEQARGHKERAFACFERALACCTEDCEEAGPVEDLQLQLGILAGELGRHAASLSYLLPWYQNNARQQRSGRVLFHLGWAYHGVGENREAMAVLQKALQFNEFDDRAMNLLGMVYLREGEGDDIALALCKKSVELEPANSSYRLDLAEVQLRCRMVREARENLYRCLRNRQLRSRAQLLVARSYLLEEKHARAKAWFDKVPALEHGRPALREQAPGAASDSGA